MKSSTVLVIDDDPSINQMLSAHLSFRGYTPTSLHSGREAIAYLKTLTSEQLPEVIFLDVLMPGMSGCDVLKVLRSSDTTKDIPVIMLSVLSQDEIQEQKSCPCSDYDGYVAKPFEMEQVVHELQEVLIA